MQKIPTMNEIQLMTAEERAALDRKMIKQIALNFAIIFGTKAVILYGIHRWAKSIAKNNA